MGAKWVLELKVLERGAVLRNGSEREMKRWKESEGGCETAKKVPEEGNSHVASNRENVITFKDLSFVARLEAISKSCETKWMKWLDAVGFLVFARFEVARTASRSSLLPFPHSLATLFPSPRISGNSIKKRVWEQRKRKQIKNEREENEWIRGGIHTARRIFDDGRLRG